MSKRTQELVMQSWSSHVPPLVSVCCITYNHENYIREAIDSLLMQDTDFPFEIIIHDDASTDSTTDIVRAYAEEYPAIIRTIIQTENKYSKGGLINPRFVFPQTRGKYIALCEGDDYWTDKTKLAKQVDYLENHPDYVITYTDCQPFDESGSLKANYRGATKDLSQGELQKATPIYTLTTCFRNVIKEIPQDLMSARYGDLVIWSLLGAYGKGKYLTNILPSAYRVHNAGVHSMKSQLQKREMLLITNNALFAYYYRLGNVDTAKYFREHSLKISLRIFGLKRIMILMIKYLIEKLKRIVR